MIRLLDGFDIILSASKEPYAMEKAIAHYLCCELLEDLHAKYGISQEEMKTINFNDIWILYKKEISKVEIKKYSSQRMANENIKVYNGFNNMWEVAPQNSWIDLWSFLYPSSVLGIVTEWRV